MLAGDYTLPVQIFDRPSGALRKLGHLCAVDADLPSTPSIAGRGSVRVVLEKIHEVRIPWLVGEPAPT